MDAGEAVSTGASEVDSIDEDFDARAFGRDDDLLLVGDEVSPLVMGALSRPFRKRAYNFGPCFSSMATSGELSNAMALLTRSRISTR